MEIYNRSLLWSDRLGGCYTPGQALHEGQLKDTVVRSENCSVDKAHWVWTIQGQLSWNKGCPRCVTSIKNNHPVGFQMCKDYSEDQNIEMGEYITWNGTDVLRPFDEAGWAFRQNSMRDTELSLTKPTVDKALEEIAQDDLLHVGGFKGERRRGVVFYLDRGEAGMASLLWWLQAWEFIGLNTAEEGFDIVIMAHPEAARNIPDQCEEIDENFVPSYGEAGQCVYKPYIGISYRDKAYDHYMNSQECLYGPGSQFLAHYQVLLRADMDTFPTPRLLGFWPKGVLVDKGYGTMMGKESIKEMLRQVACSVGIKHKEWFNLGSTWYGDARRVRNLAKLTVSLNRYGRAFMFGPGTQCRCSTCVRIPRECEWGGGPYAGVLLLYLQEIAVNSILAEAEWEALPPGLLDQGVSDMHRSVCQPALLHCMHNAEPFSKLAFGMGKYREFDMESLDITIARDYATYMALTANNQGRNGNTALERFRTKMGNNSWGELCREHWQSEH